MAAELGRVRSEDAFDVDTVHQWLLQNSDTPADKPQVQQFNSGASNLTYLLSYKERQLILRRPPVGTMAASAHDMKREFFIQKTLHPQFPILPVNLIGYQASQDCQYLVDFCVKQIDLQPCFQGALN